MSSSGRRLRKATPNTIHGKFLVVYHGWYTCPGDGQPLYQGHSGWHKWFERPIPDRGHPRFDLFPDVESYSPQELYTVPGLTLPPNGEPAKLFSSRNPATVNRHFHQMAEHGIDGVLLMRTAAECEVDGDTWSPLANLMRISDEVVDRVRAAAEAEGRVWSIMYDLAGASSGRLAHILQVDWAHLVLHKRILESPNYLREGGRPVIGIKGIGMKGTYQDPGMIIEIFKQLRSWTPGGVYVLAGVSSGWRVPGEGDHDNNPGFEAVYKDVDALCPWAVGKARDIESVDWYAAEVKEDVKTVRGWNQATAGRRRVDYIPVVFPGLSRSNLVHGAPYNEIRRQGGTFLWRQIYHCQREGGHTAIGVSFDDFNSSTAMMPAVTLGRLLPNEARFLALDADGETNLPSDWYLRICGMAGEALRGEKRIATDLMPKKEIDDYWGMRPKYEEEVGAEAGASGGSGSGSSYQFNAVPAGGSGQAPVDAGSSSGSGSIGPPAPPMRSGTLDFEGMGPPPPAYSLVDDLPEESLPAASSGQAAPAQPASVQAQPQAAQTQLIQAQSSNTLPPAVPLNRPAEDTTELPYASQDVPQAPNQIGTQGNLPQSQRPPQPAAGTYPGRPGGPGSPSLPRMESLSINGPQPMMPANRPASSSAPPQTTSFQPFGQPPVSSGSYPLPWSPPAHQSTCPGVRPGEIFPPEVFQPSRPASGASNASYNLPNTTASNSMYPPGPSTRPSSGGSNSSRPLGSPSRTEPGFAFAPQPQPLSQPRPNSPPVGGFASPELIRNQSIRMAANAMPPPPLHPQRIGTGTAAGGRPPAPVPRPTSSNAGSSYGGPGLPGAYPAGPSSAISGSSTYPGGPSTYPSGPSMYPSGPSTFPGGASTYPGGPSTYPGGPPPAGSYSPYPPSVQSSPNQFPPATNSPYSTSQGTLPPNPVSHQSNIPSYPSSHIPTGNASYGSVYSQQASGHPTNGPGYPSGPGSTASGPLPHSGIGYGPPSSYPGGPSAHSGVPPRQDSESSTSSTTFPSASTAVSSGNRPPFTGFQMPTAITQPARQALDRYAGEERRKKLEQGLDSASKWLNNLRK